MNQHDEESAVMIADLLGVWRRTSIRWPDGRRDTTNTVFWLQGSRYYADIRIPAGRPSFAGVRSIAKCSPAQRQWLATQEGFAGELVQRGDGFHWIRDVDYQPPGGPPDVGRLRFADASRDRIVEEGVLQSYVEDWERIDRGDSTGRQALVLRCEESDMRRWFVAVGDHFLLALQHADQVELSHGTRQGAMKNWIISESTMPWREGTSVFRSHQMRFDWDRRAVDEQLETGRVRPWQILEPASGTLDWLQVG